MAERPGTRQPLDANGRAALESLVRSVGPRLLAYVRRVYGRSVDAEEIVAETFCRAAANMTVLRTCERPDLYLVTTVRNLCRDGFARRRPEVVPTEQLEPYNAPTPNPPAAAERKERDDALLWAVEQLPEAQREIVVLRMSSGLKFEEIAELLHIPLGTALSRMHSAIQTLRRQCGHVYEQ